MVSPPARRLRTGTHPCHQHGLHAQQVPPPAAHLQRTRGLQQHPHHCHLPCQPDYRPRLPLPRMVLCCPCSTESTPISTGCGAPLLSPSAALALLPGLQGTGLLLTAAATAARESSGAHKGTWGEEHGELMDAESTHGHWAGKLGQKHCQADYTAWSLLSPSPSLSPLPPRPSPVCPPLFRV